MHTIYQALSIAGSDSGGGAGIQADLKTMQMQGVFGTSVITATTAQNTQGVFDVHMLPTDHIAKQIHAIYNDFDISAIKIGMLGTKNIIECVADTLDNLSDWQFGKLILDPVMIAKGGAKLLQDDAIATLKNRLLPKVDIITPNLPEAQILTDMTIQSENDINRCAKRLQDMGVKTVIIKGGHWQNSQSAVCRDFVFTPTDIFVLTSPRFDTKNTHGTGCTFSACLTAELAKGQDFKVAVQTAKDFISQAIANQVQIGKGFGPVNHWAYAKNTVKTV